MGKAKRSRKIKSANKLLKEQRKLCQAMATAQICALVAASHATIGAIKSRMMLKDGNKEGAVQVLKEMGEEIITYKDIQEKKKNVIIQIGDFDGVKMLEEIKKAMNDNEVN